MWLWSASQPPALRPCSSPCSSPPLLPHTHTPLAHCRPQRTALLPAGPRLCLDPQPQLLGQRPCVLEGAWATMVLPLPSSQPPPNRASRGASDPTAQPPSGWRGGGVCLTTQASQETPPDLPGGSSIFSLKPVSVIKGAIRPSFAARAACNRRETFNLSQELGASYKNGNFLKIQLRVFIVTPVIKETIFNDSPENGTNLEGS